MSIWDKGASPTSPVRGEAIEKICIGATTHKLPPPPPPPPAKLPPLLPKQLKLPYNEYDFDAIHAFPIEAISSGSSCSRVSGSVSDSSICIAETAESIGVAQGDRSTSAYSSSSHAHTINQHEPKTNKLGAISRGYLKRFGSLFSGANKSQPTAQQPSANRDFTAAAETRKAFVSESIVAATVVAAVAVTAPPPLKPSAGVDSGTSRSTSISSAGSSKELCCVQGGKNLVISEKSGQEIQDRGGHKSDGDCVHCDVVVDGVDQVELRKSAAQGGDKSGFILPRVILKASATDQDSGFIPQCYEKSVRERVVSHYSTEKSGSSGYYSSNIYSTGSVDEHIYSEPVIDIGNPSPKMCIDTSKLALNVVEQKQGLHNLEKSIKNLEMHLRSFQRPPTDKSTAILSPLTASSDGGAVDYKGEKRKSDAKLPTIMEGVDGQSPHSLWPPNEFDDSLMDLDLDSFMLPSEVTAVNKVRKDVVNTTFDRNGQITNKHLENNYKCSKYVNSCPDDAYNVEGVIEEVEPSIDKSLALYLSKCEDQIQFQHTKDILEEIRTKLNDLLVSGAGVVGSMVGSDSAAQSIAASSTNPFFESKLSGSSSTTSSALDLERNILSLRKDLDEYLKIMNRTNELEIKQFCTGLSKNYKLMTLRNALENRARHDDKSSVHHEDASYDVFEMRHSNYEPVMMPNGSHKPLSNYRDVESQSPFDTVYVREGFSFGYKNNSEFNDNFALPQHIGANFQLKRNSECSVYYTNCDETKRFGSIGGGAGGGGSGGCDSEQCDSNVSDAHRGGSGDDGGDVSLTQMQQNIAMQRPTLSGTLNGKKEVSEDKDLMLEWHKNKPSIWELYYGTNRLNHSLMKKIKGAKDVSSVMSYPSTRPESDFTLDLPRAEQLRIKMKKEKQFRHRCRIVTTFLSLVFFLLTVMIVSLVLTRGKRMFGSML